MIEEIDPSYEIDASMWKKIKSFDEVDLKPAAPVKPGAPQGDEDGDEKADVPEKAPRKKAEEEEEEADSGEDSGFSEIVIRTEKERDQEFREYVRELCRPQIVSFLPDRNAPRGSDIRLTCTVQGNNVQARWLKDEVLLERGKRIQTKSDGEVHSLEITKLIDKDAGEYTLVLKNRAGEVETSSRVRVFDGKLHKPDHIDIALVKDYYDHNLGGLVIEAHVHGLPLPTVKFYKDNHLIKPKKDKVNIFVENKEIYQCLMIRPDPSVSGTYTILAENKAGKKRFTHIVDFVTKYPFYNVFTGMRHADKDLDEFVEEILEHLPKNPAKEETEKGAKDIIETEKTIGEPQKSEEVLIAVAEALKAEEVVEVVEAIPDEEEKPKKKHHHRSHHKKKRRASTPSDDDGLIDDEDEVEEPSPVIATPAEPAAERRKKVEEEPHEPYEFESFRIFNNSKSLKFTGGLSNQTVIEGTNMKMVCAVSGPTPILKWLKNGKPVPWSNTIRNNSGDGLGTVIIEKIQRSDAGVYTCNAKNQFNEVTTECVVKVIPRSVLPISTSKPQFTRVLGEFYHILEDDLVLNAHCRGVPDPKIKWSKDGIEINEKTDPRYMFSYDHDGGYKFCIHKPSSNDNAIYGCEAENSTGKVKITHKVIFHEHVRHTHPQFVYHKESFIKPRGISIEPSSVNTDAEITQAAGQSGGDQVQVPVNNSGAGDQSSGQTNGGSGAGAYGGTGGGAGDGNDGGEDKRDNQKYNEDDDAEKPEGEEEEEEEVVEKREKPYRSTRRRRFEGPSEPYVIRDSVKKIQYSVKLKDYTVIAGSNIKLYCQIAGPTPVTKWFKNDKAIEWSPTIRNVSKEGAGAITIANANERDSGIYKCVTNNGFNQIETQCTVTVFKIEEVEVKPTFTRIADYYKLEVDDLIIEVHVRGVPIPKIRWSRDGVELDVENSEKFLVMREADGCYKLCIHDPQKMDSGRFIIEASNKAGKEEIRHQIRFLGKEHYKYLAGIRHADPKRQIEDDGVRYVEPEPEPIEPEGDFEEMDKWGGMKKKKEKKIRLRQKIWMPPSEESIKESAMLHEVRNRLTFESELKNAVASVGNKIKLLCTVVGPSPSLTWYKDDEPYEFAPPRVKNTSSGSFGSITFLAVNESDNGIYKCVAANQVSESESSCQLTVLPTQDPNWITPTFTRLLKEYYDQKVNDLILEVHVRGYPRPTLYWVKDGLEIYDGDEKYFATRHPDGVYRLNIHDPLIKDSGRYGCIAKNDAGSETFKYYLKVKPKEEYIHTALLHHADPTQFAKYKEEEERKRQERLAYRPPPRVVEKPAEPEPEPEPEVVEEVEEETEYETTDSEYDEEGERIEKERRKKIKKEKTPPPKEPTPPPKEPTPPPKEPTPPPPPKEPKKKRNWLEGAPEGIAEPVLEAPKPKSKFHLEFCTKLENRTSVEGAPVKLFCQIQGPRPEVEWHFNGEPIEYDGSSKNISSDGAAAIVFYKAKPEQSGEYTCIVKNRECKISAKCTLTILEMPKPMEKGLPPQFPFGIKHSYNSQIDDLIVETVIRGTPRLFVKWYKDCRELENDDKYLMAKTGETYKLFIHKPSFRDSGTYMLGVENQYGIEHLKYEIEYGSKEHTAVSGFIYHADLTKTKKFQNEEQRKKDERMAYRPPPLPKPEVVGEVPVEAEVVEEVEEESEYETTDSEYDEEGEPIEKERRKKVKKEPTPPPPPREPTPPPPKEPTPPPPKEPTPPPPKEPTPPPPAPVVAVELKEGETPAEPLAEGEMPVEPLAEGEAPAAIKRPRVVYPEIEKPLVVFRTHHIREFRKNAEVPLEIIKRLLSTVVKVGSQLKLSCVISESDPRIKVTWFKDEIPLELETRMKANCTEDGLVMLEFKNVMLEDAGRYKCLIKVKKGEIFSECDVDVYGEEEAPVTDVPPTLVTTITDLYRPQYNDITIEIRLRGNPKPTIQWIRDGLPIDQWKQYQKYQMLNEVTNNIMSCKLIITSPNQYRDNGKYVMIAKNRVKTIEFLHMLEWEPKKQEPKRKRMDEIFVVNEVPRVNPKPKSPTPPPVEEKPVEEVVEEEAEGEAEEEEVEDEEEED